MLHVVLPTQSRGTEVDHRTGTSVSGGPTPSLWVCSAHGAGSLVVPLLGRRAD